VVGTNAVALPALPGRWRRLLVRLSDRSDRFSNAGPPRNEIVYFGQGGELNAVRYGDSKVNFAGIEGNIALGKREVTKWP
jgi:hypothetical protein